MSHHMINGFITGIAVVFGGVIIAALLSGAAATSDPDSPPETMAPLTETQEPTMGVGGPAAGETPDISQLQTATGMVTDAETGEPLANVSVTARADGATKASTATGSDGRFELMGIPPEANLLFSMEGYRTVSKPGPGSDGKEYEVELEPSAIAGRVFGSDGSPIREATVASGDSYTQTDQHGNFVLEGEQDSDFVIAKAAGYETRVVPRQELQRGFTLEPEMSRGIYVSAETVASDERFEGILDMIDRTELNTLVVDIKDSAGHVHYDSDVALAQEIGAVESTFNAEQVIQELTDRDIHAVARIAVFEDPMLAEARPEFAIQDTDSDDLWRTSQDRAWANPYRSEVWDYNAALIQEAIDLGFDEILLSYVHFPIDGPLDRADYGQESTEETRQQALNDFLDRAYEESGPTPATLGADILSRTLINKADKKTGQHLISMTERLDYVHPMLYPAHFPEGEFNLELPNDHPYEVVRQSLQRGIEHLPSHLTARVRPWLQDFSAGSGMRYSDVEVREQINAATDADVTGWLLWNSENYYHENALTEAE